LEQKHQRAVDDRSTAWLAAAVGCTRRGLFYALEDLERAELLIRESTTRPGRGLGTTRYTILPAGRQLLAQVQARRAKRLLSVPRSETLHSGYVKKPVPTGIEAGTAQYARRGTDESSRIRQNAPSGYREAPATRPLDLVARLRTLWPDAPPQAIRSWCTIANLARPHDLPRLLAKAQLLAYSPAKAIRSPRAVFYSWAAREVALTARGRQLEQIPAWMRPQLQGRRWHETGSGKAALEDRELAIAREGLAPIAPAEPPPLPRQHAPRPLTPDFQQLLAEATPAARAILLRWHNRPASTDPLPEGAKP
jgi:hypothetical protein